ncbi:uncharacterized protein I303_102392 [Kwoniella dejecticola CBS 10117]|uniref:DNA-directed RNA polymerase III subunit n=1 Tax=Kwoniella dejecticola CBS 10117 TaxID=1296121 RepID=A0A1A6AB32_9TREE|nr:uncharacterized protein I303_01469 [Kwoniella dejecticola CBS 10117]OBR87267.1 hypothetical protein I303_01469 [Kwoniella dejecticola CBS 10117]
MSRGGFRGRGRGGGPGGDRGIPPGGFGAFSRQEWSDAMENLKTDPGRRGVLYPPLGNSSTAYLSGPDDHEVLVMQHTISLNSTLMTGKGVSSTNTNVSLGITPPWRIAGERKVVGIEIESYSDRTQAQAQAGPSKLDPIALKLDPAMFPPSLWAEYFEGAGQKVKPKPKKKRKIEDLDKEGDENAEDEESPPPSSDEDFDFEDDEEEEDHQDYDANYFDNGEGDDDSGGDDDDGGGGNYDD